MPTYRPEMAHSNGQSNGKRSGATNAWSVWVTRGKDRHNQNEWDDEFNTERLSQRHSCTWTWSTQQVLKQGNKTKLNQIFIYDRVARRKQCGIGPWKDRTDTNKAQMVMHNANSLRKGHSFFHQRCSLKVCPLMFMHEFEIDALFKIQRFAVAEFHP